MESGAQVYVPRARPAQGRGQLGSRHSDREESSLGKGEEGRTAQGCGEKPVRLVTTQSVFKPKTLDAKNSVLP